MLHSVINKLINARYPKDVCKFAYDNKLIGYKEINSNIQYYYDRTPSKLAKELNTNFNLDALDVIIAESVFMSLVGKYTQALSITNYFSCVDIEKIDYLKKYKILNSTIPSIELLLNRDMALLKNLISEQLKKKEQYIRLNFTKYITNSNMKLLEATLKEFKF